MHRLKNLSLATLASALVGMLLAILSSQSALAYYEAHLYGSNAWTNNSSILLKGPGGAYDQSGSVQGHIRVHVDRCFVEWCQIRSDHQAGWMPLNQLNFGLRPGHFWDGPRLNYPSGGPGVVCFYSGANFSGNQFCVPPGTYVSDLALLHRDKNIRSIQVVGNASATVCAAFKLTSYCVRVIESKTHLPEGLYGSVSSFRVY